MSTTVINMNSKSTLVAYVLWFFLGGFGIHKFYLRAPITGFIYLGLTALSGLLWLVALGWILNIPLAIFLIIDLFTIPGRVDKVNRGDTQEIFQNLHR